MNRKFFGIVSILDLIFTILWLILMIACMRITGPINSLETAIKSITDIGFIFNLTYINAIILTILTIILFSGLYLYCKSSEPKLSIIGIIFIPIYGVFNLFSYFSQIAIVPKLSVSLDLSQNRMNEVFLGLMVQGWQDSAIAAINNFAYAILGISSIAFGMILVKKNKIAKIAGIFLILNAIACIFGVIGIVVGNQLIGMGSAVGGVLFIVALVLLSLMFFKESKQ